MEKFIRYKQTFKNIRGKDIKVFLDDEARFTWMSQSIIITVKTEQLVEKMCNYIQSFIEGESRVLDLTEHIQEEWGDR